MSWRTHLSVIVGLVHQELLCTWRRSNTHGHCLWIITRMVSKIFTGKPRLVPSIKMVLILSKCMDLLLSHLSGWNLLTKQSILMLTVSGLQQQRVALLPNSTHLGVAKLVLSAQLKPVLNPE